ncbi:Rad1/Rec1/Rad17 [Thamnocephalis sphaerospora]|uniref:Rad1/Rec1/Rad17 n=1 Tax=Thamnocephalis sphaerospora TaxID=78915 RepID=A0A4P9XKC8_9FUNG|nr:Rad1/Rec1/Rad17 [Thamnocephalis sphaerospora]|eukprot:RKP06254.1 Rad1/Rec1/Rad17 [Thamnocephalis sphaerospora]
MPRLYAKLNNAHRFYTLAKAVHFKERATCTVTQQGIKIAVEHAGSVQATAYLQQDMFREYTFSPPVNGSDAYVFGIQLSTLVLVLAPLSVSDGSLRANGGADVDADGSSGRGARGGLSASRTGATSLILELTDDETLLLTMEENGVLTTCRLQSLETETQLHLDMAEAPLAYKIIMKADWLRDTLQNTIEVCDTMTISASKPPGESAHFCVSAEGATGSTEVDFTSNVDVLESFSCAGTLQQRYKSTYLQYALDALTLATKASVRANQHGLLGLQMMISVDGAGDQAFAFVEFLLLPTLSI